MSDEQQKDMTQDAAPEAKRRVFEAAQLATIGDLVPKRWVEVPEFGGASLCMWGTRREEQVRIVQDMRIAGDDDDKAITRRMVATVIECARKGDEPDAERIFDRGTHWGAIEKWPTSLLERLVNVVHELDTAGGVSVEELLDFFRMTETLGDCLMSIASACGVSTDFLASCPTTSPLRRLEWLCSRIVSSLKEKTDTSATPATESTDEAKSA